MDGFFGTSCTAEAEDDLRTTLGDKEICLRLVMKGVGILDIRDMMNNLLWTLSLCFLFNSVYHVGGQRTKLAGTLIGNPGMVVVNTYKINLEINDEVRFWLWQYDG